MEKTFAARPLSSIEYVAFTVSDPGVGMILVGEAMLEDGKPICPVFTGTMSRRSTREAMILLENVLCRLDVSDEEIYVNATFASNRAGTSCRVEILGTFAFGDSPAETEPVALAVSRAREKAQEDAAVARAMFFPVS